MIGEKGASSLGMEKGDRLRAPSDPGGFEARPSGSAFRNRAVTGVPSGPSGYEDVLIPNVKRGTDYSVPAAKWFAPHSTSAVDRVLCPFFLS